MAQTIALGDRVRSVYISHELTYLDVGTISAIHFGKPETARLYLDDYGVPANVATCMDRPVAYINLYLGHSQDQASHLRHGLLQGSVAFYGWWKPLKPTDPDYYPTFRDGWEAPDD